MSSSKEMPQLKQAMLNKHSGIMKEFNKLFTLGQFKTSLLHLRSCAAENQSKYEHFATRTVKEIRIPLIKAKPVEEDELAAKHITVFDDFYTS